MSVLQWALLIVGAAAVIAVYVISRRSNRLPNSWEPPSSRGGAPRSLPGLPGKPGADQMDMFAQGSRGGEFDEFGVGKPRKRTEAELAAAAVAAGQEPAAAPPAAPVEDKIVTLLIAEREGTAIFGPKIHLALQAQGLSFGEHRIYHRLQGGKAVFSVASLVKPGALDPAEQQGFSTPGLTMFMLLPGPAKPAAALQDMIATAQALASALNAEVFDASRQQFTAETARTLKADVGSWAQRNGV
ncbi:MAG TPA: cell division protein ZipA C-terminal FtsZ-binding domain-containing protein [Solimonas sp.]|nr:cell division protein ZipA C-terminal FtsZ-binding domain-containing protein [Solimonas sp.]